MARISIFKCLAALLIVFSSACQSKPKEDAPPEAAAAAADGKVTNNMNQPTRVVELTVNVSLAPRRNSEIQSGVLLDKKIQNCMRAEFKDGTENLSLSIQGRLGHKGEISDPLIITSSEALKTCVGSRLKHLQLGRGQSGTFKMKVERAGPLDPGGKASKTILLDLDEGKKLQ